MRIGVLGSGAVGVTIANGLIDEGHEVQIGTRQPDGDKGAMLRTKVPEATVSDFASVAKASELVFLAVNAGALEDVIELVGTEALRGKVVVDTTNAIEPSGSQLIYDAEETSRAEQVQAALPGSLVVKAFNTMGADMMYKPDFGGVHPSMFMAGDDETAKHTVADIVTSFGWEPFDCGALISSRMLEPMAIVWINNSIQTKSSHHAFKML